MNESCVHRQGDWNGRAFNNQNRLSLNWMNWPHDYCRRWLSSVQSSFFFSIRTKQKKINLNHFPIERARGCVLARAPHTLLPDMHQKWWFMIVDFAERKKNISRKNQNWSKKKHFEIVWSIGFLPLAIFCMSFAPFQNKKKKHWSWSIDLSQLAVRFSFFSFVSYNWPECSARKLWRRKRAHWQFTF